MRNPSYRKIRFYGYLLLISAGRSNTFTLMASTTPVLGVDERSKDGRQVEEVNVGPLKKNRADPPMKDRLGTPWNPAEEHRLKAMRDDGNSWDEISKVTRR